MKNNCLNYTKNMADCTCSYDPCQRKGICCECVRYHRDNNQIPGCFFSKQAEAGYDRSVENLKKDLGSRK